MPPLFDFDQLKFYTTGYFEMKNLLLMVRLYSISLLRSLIASLELKNLFLLLSQII